jgi:hypothetical protein
LLVGWDYVPCTAATSGVLYQPQMIGEGDCGAIGGMEIGRGNRSTGENLPQRHFVHHNPTWPDPGPNSDRRGGKPATNRLSYDAAFQALTSY